MLQSPWRSETVADKTEPGPGDRHLVLGSPGGRMPQALASHHPFCSLPGGARQLCSFCQLFISVALPRKGLSWARQV